MPSRSASTLFSDRHLGLQHLAPAEGQQLAGEPGGPLAGLADLLHVAADGVAAPDLVEQEVAVAQDAGEQVVEVVGDAAGQLAHRLHLLGLAELLLAPAERLLRRLLLGDIAMEHDRPADLVRGAANRHRRGQDHA
jgi:hypothetical protein